LGMLPTLTYAGKVYRNFPEAAQQAANDLGTAKDVVDRRFAIAALNRIGPVAVPHVGELVSALKDEDTGVRYWAVITLAGLGPEAAPPPADVAALFKEEDPGIRYWAAVLLGKLGPPAADQVEVLTTALKDLDPDVRVAAAEALLTVDPRAIPNAVKVISSILQYKFGEDFFRASAAKSLGVIGLPAMPEAKALGTALGDKYASVRKAAALALKALGRDAVRVAVVALGSVADADVDGTVRDAAGQALSELGLAAALEDADANVRHWAVLTLVDMGLRSIEHAPALANLLVKDTDKRIRAGAATALGGAGKAAVAHSEALTRALTDVDAAVRTEAAKALAVVNPDGGPSAAAVIAPGLKDKDPLYRLAAAEGLRELGSSALQHVFALEELMKDGRAEIRVAAVRALLSVGRGAVKGAQADLAELAKSDPDAMVRRAALTALDKCELSRRWRLPPPVRPLV